MVVLQGRGLSMLALHGREFQGWGRQWWRLMFGLRAPEPTSHCWQLLQARRHMLAHDVTGHLREKVAVHGVGLSTAR